MAGPSLPKCPVCSTPIPPRAWKAVEVAESAFHPECVEPPRAAEAAALRAGRSAFPAGVAGFIEFVRLRDYEPGRENMLLRVAALSDGVLQATATLLDRGASASATDARGRTALHVAAEANAADTCLVLLQRGADAYTADAQGRTPLHCAAAVGAYASLYWLLAAGAPLESRDATGATPLLVAAAASKDEPNCITALLRGGADMAARNRQGLTALHLAASVSNVSCIETLVWAGASKNARARDGRRPQDCTQSLPTRLALEKAQRGPPEDLLHRPPRLGMRLVAAAFVAVVGLFVKGLVFDHREAMIAVELNREQMMQLMLLRNIHKNLRVLTALLGPRIQPFTISMSAGDLQRLRGDDDGVERVIVNGNGGG